MAAKMNVMKLLQEIRGLAIFSSRRVQSKLPALSSTPRRPFPARAGGFKRKRVIRVEMQQATVDIPDPVKITHVQVPTARTRPSQTP